MSEIVWVDDPLKYTYLREGICTASGRFPVKGITKRLEGLKVLVGYCRSARTTLGIFDYIIFWLKDYDRDFSPDGVYAGPKVFGGKMPFEAVDPVVLLKTGPKGLWGGEMRDMKGTYIVGSSADDLEGWTAESLAAALKGPLTDIGVEVLCEPQISGVNEGLRLKNTLSLCESDAFREQVQSIVEKVISGP